MNTIDVDSISSYFARSKNCLDLKGANKKITKQQFQQKVEEIPMLANFIRVETLFRDKEIADTIALKTKLQIPIFCTFTLKEYVFNFEFYHRRIAIQEGATKFVGLNDKKFTFEMNGIYEEDTLLDVRIRIAEALNHYFETNLHVKGNMNTADVDIISDVVGNREFYVLSTKDS